VECALKCEDEGAAIIHIHARDKEENASDDPEFFQEVVDRLKGRTNLIIKQSIKPLTAHIPLQSIRELVLDPRARLHDALLMKRRSLFQWRPGAKWKKTTSLIYWVRNKESLVNFSEITFEINPNQSNFFVNHYNMYDEDLTAKGNLGLGNFYVTKNHNTTIHPENLLIHLPVQPEPGLDRVLLGRRAIQALPE